MLLRSPCNAMFSELNSQTTRQCLISTSKKVLQKGGARSIVGFCFVLRVQASKAKRGQCQGAIRLGASLTVGHSTRRNSIDTEKVRGTSTYRSQRSETEDNDEEHLVGVRVFVADRRTGHR